MASNEIDAVFTFTPTFYKPKIEPWFELQPKLEKILQDEPSDVLPVVLPDGPQTQHVMTHPRSLLFALHAPSATGDHLFVSHHGVGEKMDVSLWKVVRTGSSDQSSQCKLQRTRIKTKIHTVILVQSRFTYVAACYDLSLRVFSSQFLEMSNTETFFTTLSLLYNEAKDQLLTGSDTFIQVWNFPVFAQDQLIPGKQPPNLSVALWIRFADLSDQGQSPGGVLPYMCYAGLCRLSRYLFEA